MNRAWKHALVVLGLAVIVGTPELGRGAEPDWKAVEGALSQTNSAKP